MKKSTKVMLITGASIIAVGVVFTTVGLVRGSSTSVGTAENYEKKVYDFSDDINNIKIKNSSHDVTFVKSDDKDTHVTVYDSDSIKHFVDVSSDTLNIDYEQKMISTHFFFNINLNNTRIPYIEVALPEDQYDSLVIDMSSAELYSPSDFTFDDTKITTSSGDIQYASKATDRLEIKTSSGCVNLESTGADITSINTTSGDVFIKEISAGNLDIKTSSGNITGDTPDAKSISLEATSGDIQFKDVKCEKGFEADTSSGGIKVNNITATDVRFSSTSGDQLIEDGTFTGSGNFKTSSGELDLNDCSFKDLQTSCNSGDFSFKELTVEEGAVTETSSGEVTGTVTCDFFYVTKTSSGDVKTPESAKIDREFRITTSSGDISIKK